MLQIYLSLIEDAVEQKLFENIYITYRKQMLLTALSILNNEQDAEDAVHDVFTVIAANRMSFIKNIKDPEDLRCYLLTATKNTSLNHTKRKKYSPVSVPEIDEFCVHYYSDIDDDVFIDRVCLHAEYSELVTAILSLDEHYRDVMYCHFVLEMSVPATAKHLNRKVETTKKQLTRGKKILLSKLGYGDIEKNGNN